MRVWIGLFSVSVFCLGVLGGYVIPVTCSKGKAYYRPNVGQSSRPFCGLSAVATICTMAGRTTNLSEAFLHAGVTAKGTTLAQCQQAMTSLGVPNKLVEFTSLSELPERVPILCPLHVRTDQDQFHAVTVYRVKDRVLVIDGRHTQACDVDMLSKATLGLAIVPLLGNSPAGTPMHRPVDRPSVSDSARVLSDTLN
jgi:ABC-type bacteriocin/lantibiotic exporter with double-glycine peptidase domain